MLAYLEKAPSLTVDRERELLLFLDKNGLAFNDMRLLNLAFVHTSYANEHMTESNERLEFLGDSILGMVTAEYLFSHYTRYHEGDFSKIKSVVVSEQSLSEVAAEKDIGSYMLLGRGEQSQNGNLKKAILADAMEAVIAALFIDQGIEAAKRFVLSFIPMQIDKLLTDKIRYKDYKTQLQEYLQKRRGKVPKYTLVSQTGPDHEQIFAVTVELGTKTYGPAEGRNKKSAEQAVARMALIALGLEKE